MEIHLTPQLHFNEQATRTIKQYFPKMSIKLFFLQITPHQITNIYAVGVATIRPYTTLFLNVLEVNGDISIQIDDFYTHQRETIQVIQV